MAANNIFTIPAAVLYVVEDKVAKLNKRVRKIGGEPVTIKVSIPRQVEDVYHEDLVYTRADGVRVTDVIDVTVEGVAPTIDGYTFIATIDCRGDNPIIRVMPGAPACDLSEFYTTTAARCDHCHMHRDRNDVLILREDATGNLIQIGRNCAADFFRSKDAAKLVQQFSLFAALGDENWGGGWDGTKRAEVYVPVMRVLEMAAACTRTFGFVKSGGWDEYDTRQSTKSRVYCNMFVRHRLEPEDRATVTDEDRAVARETYDWLQTEFVLKADKNDFEHNVAGVIENDMVRERNFGFVVWMPNGLARHKQTQAERDAKRLQMEAIKAQRAAAGYIGTPGDRIEFTATLRVKRHFDSYYGTKTMLQFVDDAGNTLVWWTTSVQDTVEGTTYSGVGTVKNHTEYKGCKQTVLRNVKLYA